MYHHTKRFVLVALTSWCLVFPVHASDQVPFKGTFSGQVISATPVSNEVLLFEVQLSGISTHLGSFTGDAEIFQNVANGSYSGSFTWTAPNGDTVSGSFTGQLIPTSTPGLFDNIEEITLSGGTGRFSDVTGNATGSGQLDQNSLSFLFPFQGTISSVGSQQTP